MKTTESTPIICGTDFSENAKQAATAAAVLAARSGKTLLLVHVTDHPHGRNDQKELVEFLRPLEKRLQDEADRLREVGAPVETKVLTGGLAGDSLKELGEERNASLVVVSSVSKTAFNRWTLGSVSESLAQTDPVPTLVVRDAAPFEAWARAQRALKVFVCTDFTAISEAALRWVAELRQIGPVDVLAGYVDWPPQEATPLGASGPQKQAQRIIERDLQENATRLLGEEHVSVRASANWGRPDIPLVEMAIEAQADLVVVGTHQWSGFSWLRHGSVSRGILRHAPMSVVCVPSPAIAPVTEPRIRECRRVLIAVDLNEPHDFAVSYGYSIIPNGGTVRLVHNVMPLQLPSATIGAYYQEFPTPTIEPAQLIANMEAQLHALAPSEMEARGITTEVEVTQNGETAKSICAAAERFNADIICIGGHTRPGLVAKALGSVSLAVLQSSRRPVLVVWPPPAR